MTRSYHLRRLYESSYSKITEMNRSKVYEQMLKLYKATYNNNTT